MTNAYEEAQRERKAAALAHTLRTAGTTADAARALDASGRRIVEAAAAVNPSSDATWQLACEKLERHPAGGALSLPDDPYEGLPGGSR